MNENGGLVQKKRMAVAYLIQAKDERPDGLEKFFDKLAVYENSMRELMEAGKEAENALNQLNTKTQQMFGSIDSVVSMIADELPDDKCLEWAEKFVPPTGMPAMAGGAPMKRVDGSVDMAGSTSRQADAQMQAPIITNTVKPTV